MLWETLYRIKLTRHQTKSDWIHLNEILVLIYSYIMTPLLHEKINTSIKFLGITQYQKVFFSTSCADPYSHLSEEELAAKFILWVNMVGQDAGKVVLLRHKKIQWHHFHWNYGIPALLIPAKIDSPNWSIITFII